MTTEGGNQEIGHNSVRSVWHSLTGLIPSVRARRDARAQARLEHRQTEEVNRTRIGELRSLYQRFNRPEIISSVASLDGYATRFEIDRLGGFTIKKPSYLPDPEEVTYIDRIIVNGAGGLQREFDRKALVIQGGSDAILTVTAEEVAGVELMVGLTEVTLGLVRAVEGESFKSTGPQGLISFKAQDVAGETDGRSYRLLFSDSGEDARAKRVADLYPKEVAIGEIAIYIGDIVYLIRHKHGQRVLSLAKIDISDKASNLLEQEKYNRFAQEDLDTLSNLLPTLPNVKVNRWVYIQPGSTAIYRGESITPGNRGRIERRESERKK